MPYCELCGEDEMFDLEYMEFIAVNGKRVMLGLCHSCHKRMEDHHGIDGKLVIELCKECGGVTKKYWKKYEQRGRPRGSKNKPKPSPIQVLDVFLNPLPPLKEEGR